MDKHNTARISQVLSILVSIFFVVIAVAGYQETGDIKLVLLFVGLAIIAYFIVKLLFMGVNRLLDSLDNKRS
ncbi:MAG: hypothetical protein V7731_12455 [Amphritea sp.]